MADPANPNPPSTDTSDLDQAVAAAQAFSNDMFKNNILVSEQEQNEQHLVKVLNAASGPPDNIHAGNS